MKAVTIKNPDVARLIILVNIGYSLGWFMVKGSSSVIMDYFPPNHKSGYADMFTCVMEKS